MVLSYFSTEYRNSLSQGSGWRGACLQPQKQKMSGTCRPGVPSRRAECPSAEPAWDNTGSGSPMPRLRPSGMACSHRFTRTVLWWDLCPKLQSYFFSQPSWYLHQIIHPSIYLFILPSFFPHIYFNSIFFKNHISLNQQWLVFVTCY